MTKTNNIRLLVVDDHPVVRTGLVTMIHYEPGMEPAGEATNGREAVEQFRTLQPDVTLMDLQMPQMSGVEATTAILHEFPQASIIILTTYDGEEDIYRALKAGAKGYLLKDASRQELIDAIRIVHAGQKYLTLPVATKLAQAWTLNN